VSSCFTSVSNSCMTFRWTHEYMFSLNLAWAIVWIERVASKTLGGNGAASIVAKLVRGAEYLVSPIGGRTILEQLLWSFIRAGAGFLLLRLLSRFAITNIALRTISGALAVASFPFATLLYGFSRPSWRNSLFDWALFLEVAIILTCAVLYYLRNRFVTAGLLIAFFVFHFAMWAWLTSSYFDPLAFIGEMRSTGYYHPWGRTLSSLGISIVFNFGFPIFGLLASLTWVRYVKHSGDYAHRESA
jgi:hypothetical protein